MRFTVPNQLTVLRIILTPVFLFFFRMPNPEAKITGTIIFFIAAATDWYDGYIARKMNIVSRWGQFMDPLADKLLISSAIFVFAYLNYLYWWMVIIIIVRDFLITFLRMYALQKGKAVVTSIAAKWKTFLQMTAVIILLLYLNYPGGDLYRIQIQPPDYSHWVTIMFLVVTVITLYTGIQYLIENRSHVFELGRRTMKFIRR